MSRQFQFVQWLSEVIDAVAGSHTDHHQKRIQTIAEFRKQEHIFDLQTQQQLKKLEIQFTEQLKRVQERESRITQDYRELLDNIDEMKIHIVESFPEMPKVMALIIHQHAKQLVDKMWNDSTEHDQRFFQAELASFLELIFDDTTRVLTDKSSSKIPLKTLAHIENNVQTTETDHSDQYSN